MANYNGIYYKLFKRKSPVIIFVHGLGGNTTSFSNQVNFFKKLGSSTLVLDLRGHGQSTLNGEISIKNHVKDINKILEHENIKQVNLVGFSMGAMVALEFASQNPKKVGKIILLNPGVSGKRSETKILRIVIFLLKLLVPLARVDRREPKVVNLTKGSSHIIPATLRRFATTNLKGMFANITAVEKYGLPSYLEKVEHETLIIQGKNDELFTEEAPTCLNKLLRNSKVKRIPGRHAFLVDKSNEINKEIAEKFLTEFEKVYGEAKAVEEA